MRDGPKFVLFSSAIMLLVVSLAFPAMSSSHDDQSLQEALTALEEADASIDEARELIENGSTDETEDGSGSEDEGSVTAASFTSTPAEPVTGETVTFDGTASTCAVDPCTYEWTDEPPDGGVWELGSGEILDFTFSGAGDKYVNLTVTDADGGSDKVEQVVTVTDDGSTDDGSTDDGSTDDGSTDDGSTDDDSTSDSDGDAYTFTGQNSGTVEIPAGYPNPATTGLEGAGVSESDLTVYDGPYSISSGTHVIERAKLTSQLTVSGSAQVTIRESLIEHGGRYGLHTEFSDPGEIVLEDSDVRMTDGDSMGIVGPNFTVRRSDIRYGEDTAHLHDNTVIEDSFLADPGYPSNSDGHYDGVQSVGTTSFTVTGSTVLGPWQNQTSAFILKSDRREIKNVQLEGNFVSGGTYTVYLRDGGSGNPSAITVRDNLWAADSWKYGAASLDCGSNWTWSNNRDTDGNTISGC